jgi:diadenosine tetraphosphate (Ap4A) HIT family hydrolase
MASVFTMIINGELPGRFVWDDDQCVAFLTINPLTPGHTLVVPRAETDEWTDLGPDLWSHLSGVSHTIGRAIKEAFDYTRVGVVIAGFEVRHAHIHVFGADTMAQFDFARVDPNPNPDALDAAAAKIAAALEASGAAGGGA